MKIDGEKVRRALASAHASERSSTNPQGASRVWSARYAARVYKLNRVEREILFNGLSIDHSDLPEEIEG